MYRRTSYARQPYSSSLSGGYSSYLTTPRSSSSNYGGSSLTNGYSRSAGYESDYGGSSSSYRSPRRYGGARTDSNLDAAAGDSSQSDATARSYRGARSQQDLSTLDAGGSDYSNGGWRSSSSYGQYGNGRAAVASTSYHPRDSTSSYGGRYNFSRDSKSVTRDAGSDRYTSPYSATTGGLSRSGSRSRLSEVVNDTSRAPSVPPRRHSSKASVRTATASGEASRDGKKTSTTPSRYADRGIIRSSSSRDLREFADASRTADATSSRTTSSRTTPGRKIRHQTLTFGVSPVDLDRARSLNESSSFRRSGSIGDVSRVGGFQSDMSVGPLVTVSSSGMVTLGARARERERERARRASASSDAYTKKSCSTTSLNNHDDVGYSSQPASRRDSVSVRFLCFFFVILCLCILMCLCFVIKCFHILLRYSGLRCFGRSPPTISRTAIFHCIDILIRLLGL